MRIHIVFQNLNRRYSNHAADVKKLKLAEARIQVSRFILLEICFELLVETCHEHDNVCWDVI